MTKSTHVPKKRKVSSQGLVLDDVITGIALMRRTFDLPEKPERTITQATGFYAREAVSQLVRAVMTSHGHRIFATGFSAALSAASQGGQDASQVAPELHRRLASEEIEPALRSILDDFLDTVTQLPPRDARPDVRSIVALSSHSKKLALKLRTALEQRSLSSALPRDSVRIHRILADLTWLSVAIDDIRSKSTKEKKIPIDRPNPQVRLALYFTRWVEAATGEKKFEALEEILEAAFNICGKPIPRWVNRLAVEMHQKRRQRKAWATAITVRSST